LLSDLPEFYGIDPKVSRGLLGPRELRTTVVRHFLARKKAVEETAVGGSFYGEDKGELKKLSRV
jgi:hypothetical protein